MAVEGILYDNWGNTTIVGRTYEEIPSRFEMQSSAGTTVIEEPVGWDKISFVHERDKDYHGFNYEMLGGDIDLRFDCDSGIDIIKDEYALNGNDGEVLLRKVLEAPDGDIIEYEGRLNLNTRADDKMGITCSVERKSLHQLISSRLSTKIKSNSETDLDDNSLPLFAEDYIALPGQTLLEKFKANQPLLKQEAFTETRTGDESAYLFFSVSDPTVNTVPGFIPSTLGISGDNLALRNHSLFIFPAAGHYTLDIAVDFQVELRIHPRFLGFAKKVTQAFIYVQINIYRKVPPGGDPLDYIFPYTIYQIPPFNPNVQGFQFPRVTATFHQEIDIEAGDELVFFAFIKYKHNANKLKSVDIKVKEFKTTFNMSGFSFALPTVNKGVLIKELMQRLLLRMTSQNDILKSNFYSRADEEYITDGCGAFRFITNGGSLRSAPFNDRFPITTTWNDTLEAINAIDAIGLGYEWDPVNQKETIRVEPKEYFYKDAMVFEILTVSNYKQTTAKDLIYNKIVVGYDKYKEDEDNSLNELHAYHEYQTPIKTESNEYTIRSKFNASGYLIEVTRRINFEEDQTSAATTYDDDIFIIHCQPNPEAGGFNPPWIPVADEPFTETSDVLYPETTMNLTLVPKRMLMAHSKWLMSSLIYKSESQIIKNTLTKQNIAASTTLDPAYCLRGDLLCLPLRADADIILGAFGDGTGIYSPEWINFTTRMTMQEVRYIMNAHRGLSPDDNNYGWLLFPDEDGNPTKGYLYSLSFDPENEEATMRVLKKKSP